MIGQFFNAGAFHSAEQYETLAGIGEDLGDLPDRLRLIQEVDARFKSPVIAFEAGVIHEEAGVANEQGIGQGDGNCASAGAGRDVKADWFGVVAERRIQVRCPIA